MSPLSPPRPAPPAPPPPSQHAAVQALTAPGGGWAFNPRETIRAELSGRCEVEELGGALTVA